MVTVSLQSQATTNLNIYRCAYFVYCINDLSYSSSDIQQFIYSYFKEKPFKTIIRRLFFRIHTTDFKPDFTPDFKQVPRNVTDFISHSTNPGLSF